MISYQDPQYVERACKCGSQEPVNNEGECEHCETTRCAYCGNTIRISESKPISTGKRICKEHNEDINQE